MAVCLSMVALGKDAKISGRAICDAWRTRWPGATQPAGMEKKESTFSFHVGEHLVAFGLMPAPIPGMTDGEQPAARTPFWPNASADLRRHQRHVIVTVVGGANPIDEMRVLTQATVALVDSCQGAVGVYWPSSELLFPAKSFCDIACTVVFGYLLYTWFPFLRGSVFRHFVLLPLTLVFGVFLLLISDQIILNAFGLHSFHDEKS